MKKIVLDANVWITCARNGELTKLTDVIDYYDLQVFTSKKLITEILDVLKRPKFQALHENIGDVLDVHLAYTIEIDNIKYIYRSATNPDDDFLINLCKEVKCKLLVSNDNLVLLAAPPEGISVLTLPEFRTKYPWPKQ